MLAPLRPVVVRLVLLFLLAALAWWSARRGSDILWPAALVAHLVALALAIAAVRCRPRGDVPGAVAGWLGLGLLVTVAAAVLWLLWLRVLDPAMGRLVH